MRTRPDDPVSGKMPRDEELRLVQRAQRGDAQAFRQLVESYQDRLFGFVWRMVRNHHEAEDLCQTAFVKAYESLASYSRQYAFSTWLFTIAYRLCLNQLRKRKPVGGEIDFSRFAHPGEDSTERVANSESARLLRRVIWEAVEQLSPSQKACVLLFYREGRSCQEIGETLEMPAVTVKSHLHRAREKLGTLLRTELDDWTAVSHLSDTHYA
jgi:RNA polymerase sigma-70 factor (ECF subfamily)